MASKSKKPAPVDTFILLDRSGSMASQWNEAISSINAYVDGLRKREVPGNVTLAVFDEAHSAQLSNAQWPVVSATSMQFDVIRNQSVAAWEPLSAFPIQPRGGTPLYDAIGRIVHLAERTMPSKAVIVIMTDGYENASRAMTQQGAREKLDGCRGRDWQVVFLGANFDTFAQGSGLGSFTPQMLNAVPQAYGAVMSDLAAHTHNYTIGGGLAGMSSTGNVEFTSQNRATASGVVTGTAANDNDKKKRNLRSAA